METTGIRLEVEPWLYQVLIEEQEQRRLKTGRKQSLSTIIIEFCTKGLTVFGLSVQNKADSVQKNSDSVFNIQGFVQNNHDNNPPMYQTNLYEIAKLKETLLRQEQELQEKEHRLANKESEIKEKENELVEKSKKTIHEWNEILDNKEKAEQKSLDNIQLKWKFEQQTKELADKTESNKKLKQDNYQLKEDIIRILQKIDQQTEKSIIIDYIVPFLPSIISIIGFFITNRKIDNIKELLPVQEEIGNIMKKLSDTDKKKLSEKLEESLKSFTIKPVTGK
jgi:DNA repair exonuclease SbcCD ATPase subunit